MQITEVITTPVEIRYRPEYQADLVEGVAATLNPWVFGIAGTLGIWTLALSYAHGWKPSDS